MKKILALAAAAAMLLGGCSQPDGFAALQEGYREAGDVSARMDIQVLSQGVVIDYTVDYRREAGEGRVEILAPESLSGITARLRTQGGEVRLEYEGAGVETLLPMVPGFSPADAFHSVLADLADGVPTAQGTQRSGGVSCLSLTYTAEGEGPALEKQVLIDSESGAVIRCEFFISGQMVMTLSVQSISIF